MTAIWAAGIGFGRNGGNDASVAEQLVNRGREAAKRLDLRDHFGYGNSMGLITKFEQIRADGRTIPADMTVSEMLRLEWAPCRVIALRWICCGDRVEFAAPDGIHGIVVPSANFVAAIAGRNASVANGALSIISANGSLRSVVPGRLIANGLDLAGRFSWFENAIQGGADMFGAVFQSNLSGDYRCDIDARTGILGSVVSIR